MQKPKLLRADLALILITVIWGCTFTIVKKSLVQVSPLLFLALRFWIATLVLAVFLPHALRGITRETLRRGSLLAAFLFAGFLFQTVGLISTTPSRSAFITSLSVLLVPLLGFALLRLSPDTRTLAGIGIATIGLGFLTLNSLELRITTGDAVTLLCAVAFAFHILYLGRYLATGDFQQLAILQLAGSALLSTLFMPAFETPFLVWDSLFALYLFITGVLATGLAFYLQNRAQRVTTATRAALIFSLEPFFAALFAYLILGDALTGKEWFGGCLVLTGVLVSELRTSGGNGEPSHESGKQ
jgi:drug/metabolite transporter (DMT)-like permease